MFKLRAVGVLPDHKQEPGKGLYSAYPPPPQNKYDVKLRTEAEMTLSATESIIEPELVPRENIVCKYPPHLDFWEKAVGYKRRSRADLKAKAAARAAQPAAEETGPEEETENETVKMSILEDGKLVEIEMATFKFGRKYLESMGWQFPNGLGANGTGRRMPVDSYAPYNMARGPPERDPEFIWFRPDEATLHDKKMAEQDEIVDPFDTMRPGSFPFKVRTHIQILEWDRIVNKHPSRPVLDQDNKPQIFQVEVDIDNDDWAEAFHAMYDYEIPVSIDSAVNLWTQAASDPSSLRQARATTDQSTEPAEPVQPIFAETWKQKSGGKHVKTHRPDPDPNDQLMELDGEPLPPLPDDDNDLELRDAN